MGPPRDLSRETTTRRRARARFFVTAAGVLVAGLAGYSGFVALLGTDRGTAAGTLVLAAATGFGAFFSPCSFPLMLTFLTRQAAASRQAAAVSTLIVAVGAASLLALVALVLVVGGEALGRVVEFNSITGRIFRLTVGALLIVLGLRQTQLIRARMGWLDNVATAAARVLDPSRMSGRFGRDFVYGFGYLLAGFG